MELKRIQLAYRHSEGMGVPISGDLLSRSRKPNFDGVFRYLYDGTTKEDYNLALSVETSNCSVTFSEFSSKHNKDNNKIEWMEQELSGEKENQTECFTCEFTADDVDNVALQTPQISKQMSLEHELAGEKEDQTECFTCEFTADDADNVTLQTPQKSKHISLGKKTICVEMEMRWCQGNSLFLSPTTQKLHNSIEKASEDTQTLCTTKSLKEARKNIISSVDHILQHGLVWENPIAAEFVSTIEKEMQNIKERFNTKMMSILGSKIGRDDKLCYPSFKN
jgi:hypothetical protein